MVNSYKKTAFAAALAGCFVAGAADASHFRGGALVPEVDASGLLTITATTFWRPTSNGRLGNINIGGAGTSGSFTRDTTDSRFDRVVETYTRQLAGAGTTVISDSSCCRVQGIRNGVSSNTSVNFSLSSTIVWDGVNANTPILFDFAGVQNEVVRGANYSQNLNALSGSGHTLTYDAALNDTRFNQPPGFAINAATGEMTIPSINTATFLDNASGNTGADYYFSGTIKSSDGSLVTLDWLFDSVGTASNLAPVVDDIVINALVGDNISHIVTGLDPEGLPLTWDLLSFLGSGGNMLQMFDPGTQTFSWDTTGAAVGTYIANIRASDGSLTDVGTITINLTNVGNPPPPPPPPGVPAPATVMLLGLGLLGLGATRRRKA